MFSCSPLKAINTLVGQEKTANCEAELQRVREEAEELKVGSRAMLKSVFFSAFLLILYYGHCCLDLLGLSEVFFQVFLGSTFFRGFLVTFDLILRLLKGLFGFRFS